MMSRTGFKNTPKGIALLMVLAIIMAITVLSLGFLARTNTELTCGQNMALRVQMDQTAASGLEHARGLMLHPPDSITTGGYWPGATAQQLDPTTADFYDVNVVPDVNDHCNYFITCDAYRLRNAEKVGRSAFAAQLRLDPCIAFWLGPNTAIPQATVIDGDLYCGGNLVNQGTIQGDVFAIGTISGVSPQGRATSFVASPPLSWPDVNDYYDGIYRVGDTEYLSTSMTSTPTGTFIPDLSSNPGGVCYRDGNVTLSGDVAIKGLLVVTGNLTVRGSNTTNAITAVKGFPALLVRGDVIVESGGRLTVDGLAVIEGKVLVSASAGRVTVTGGLLAADGFWETTDDASGNALTGTVHGAPTWTTGRIEEAIEFDGVDDYVDCGDDPSLAITTAITVAAWVKTKDVGNGQHNPFVTRGDRTYGLKHNESGKIEFFIYDNNTWWSAAHAPGSSFNGTWHHVAGTYDGSDVRLYIDGVERHSTPHTGTIDNQAYSLNIGRNAEEADRFYNGAIDEVCIYARALSAVEILFLHNNPGLLADTTGLRARYLFNEVGANVDINPNPAAAAIVLWDWHAGDMEWKGRHWGPAVGAFFKSVDRQ